MRFLRVGSLSLLTLSVVVLASSGRSLAQQQQATTKITIPGDDRFVPFAVTVKVGTKVEWVNKDTEGHYLVSNNKFNTAGHRGVNMLIPAGGKVSLVFNQVGVFPFYCSLHSMLDADHQPKAPGPAGGIQDQNGNYGTPMNGVVTVIK